MADNRLSCEETELRLGLPINSINYGKRVRYDDETSTVDFNLNLSSKENDFPKEKNLLTIKPPAKTQVVGWPPVRSFRKNVMSVQKKTDKGSGVFVKVSVDGAPYLRKVDLKMYQTYQDLSNALAKMFSSFTIGKCDSQGMMNDSKLMDLLNGSDYVPTYEDKDGDWMLVGDVPWEMFVESCKRLRIMKATEARGLAMEKCKFNRS